MVRGFTLIELSIVLIIIGLLVGGVLAGRDLIEQAKLNRVVNDFRGYETAIRTFELKYDAIPGDMDNATSFWSGTANGDGNHYADAAGEQAHVFEHLSRAGLVGDFEATGSSGSDRFNFGAGQTGPEAPFEGTGYIYNSGPGSPVYGLIGGKIQIVAPPDWDEALTPLQALGVDQKMDDGGATTGRVVNANGIDLNDATASDDCTDAPASSEARDYEGAAGSGDFLLTNSAVACRTLYFFN